MLFRDIIGQENVKQRLRQSVADSRISHAQLFLGNEGSGNLALALAYVQYISCEDRTPEDSCGTCPSCFKYSKLVHPDLHFVFPVIKPDSKPKVSDDYITEWRLALLENPYMNQNIWINKITNDNKQGGIFEAESGEIIRKMNLKSFESDYKTILIWLPEKMHPHCSNKLLKLLEEPPEKTLFLLVAVDSSKILATILSRCQMIKIGNIDKDSMNIALQNLNVEEPILSNVVHLANGNYLKACELLNQTENDKYNFDQFTKWMRMCYGKKIVDMIKWVDEISVATVGRENQKDFLNYSLRMLRENFILNTGTPEIVYLTDEEQGFSQKFHPFINERNIYGITEEISKAHYYIESNANPKILFFDLSLKVTKLLHC